MPIAWASVCMGLSTSDDAPAREFKECLHCPTMVELPAGRFVMGSHKNESG